MDWGLLWTILGSVAGIAAVGLGYLQLRQAQQLRDARPGTGRSIAGGPTSVPTGRLPSEVLGREVLLGRLSQELRHPRSFVVLAGVGGVGKSTVATELCRLIQGRRSYWRSRVVWWISAADAPSLTLGMVSVVKLVGGTDADALAVSNGADDGPDRVWRLLDHAPFRWLLVVDNADDPTVLDGPHGGVPGTGGPVSAGTGWVRSSRRGLSIVTSRNGDSRAWGGLAVVCNVEPLDSGTAAKVLLNLAPAAGALADAERLAARLGGLPLALHVAGTYLSYPLARWTTFKGYLEALVREPLPPVLAHIGRISEARESIMSTWELSLDALQGQGIPQARPLLRLLSCWAAAAPIPVYLLDSHSLGPLFGETADPRTLELELERALHGLSQLGLLGNAATSDFKGVVVHPAIADASRLYLRTPTAADPNPDIVRETAVRLLTDSIAPLAVSEPHDWPRFAAVTPHLLALFETTAEALNLAELGALCDAAATTALSYDWSGGLAAAENLTTTALSQASPLGVEHPFVLRLRQQEALQEGRRGLWGEANAAFTELASTSKRQLGSDHHITLAIRHDLARSMAHVGQWEEAEAECRDVVATKTQLYGADHVQTLATRHHLVRALAAQRKWTEANAMFPELLSAEQRILGDDHVATLATRDALARSLADQGRWPEAQRTYELILTTRSRLLGEEHPTTLTNLAGLARTLESQRNLRRAETLYQEVLSSRTRVLGENHPDTIMSQKDLERVRRELNQKNRPAEANLHDLHIGSL